MTPITRQRTSTAPRGRRPRTVTRGMWWVVLALLGAPELAQATCWRGGGSSTLPPPAQVTFSARGVEVGGALTPWLAVNNGAPTGDFQCNRSEWIKHWATSTGAFLPGLRYAESGSQFVVYPTGVEGVGMAFLIEHSRDRRGTPFALGDRDVDLYQSESGTDTFGTRIMMKYIRTGDIKGGTFGTSGGMIVQSRILDYNDRLLVSVNLQIAANVLQIQDRPSCRMRTQEVQMPPVWTALFKGVGTHAGQRSYELQLDCEGGVGQVDYQVVPTTPVLNSAQGLAEATGGVKGVAYQFLNEDGSPMRFYGSDVFGYGSSNAEVLRKTFGVRYQQTEPTITPGAANAGLVFSLTFP